MTSFSLFPFFPSLSETLQPSLFLSPNHQLTALSFHLWMGLHEVVLILPDGAVKDSNAEERSKQSMTAKDTPDLIQKKRSMIAEA
ncbi:MAG: hypothetical protein U1D97_07025, partial [Desulfuromonadales bacterium]|nr:hypothetical protein [Desulfuromonadales bacterium]